MNSLNHSSRNLLKGSPFDVTVIDTIDVTIDSTIDATIDDTIDVTVIDTIDVTIDDTVDDTADDTADDTVDNSPIVDTSIAYAYTLKKMNIIPSMRSSQ